MQPSASLAFPLPQPPSSRHARQTSIETDLHTAFHLLRRSDAARRFILTTPTPADHMAILTTPRPSFTIATEEDQLGKLPGRIALSYLGLPAFCNTEGMSGGLVVTSYVNRTHPLHDPSVMADVRVGRYVRHNATGEWCILTRGHEGISRLQYMRVTQQGARERIGLTCNTRLFEQGRFLDSVLFKCHDHEWRICHRCACSRCHCRTPPPASSGPPASGLDAVALSVVREGADDWLGTVRVTVVASFPNDPFLDIDDTMTVRSSYQPSLDAALASQLQRLAIAETVKQGTTVPSHLLLPNEKIIDAVDAHELEASRAQTAAQHQEEVSLFQCMETASVLPHVPGHAALQQPQQPQQAVVLSCNDFDPVEDKLACAVSAVPDPLAELEESAPLPTLWSDMVYEDYMFGGEAVDEIADHFLIPNENRAPMWPDEDEEEPMLPADPTTLPGGLDICLEDMDIEEFEEIDDDCFSLMTSDRDARSVNSALSTWGSDGAPQLDSVPPPGDDFIDAISALKLSCTPCSPNGMELADECIVREEGAESMRDDGEAFLNTACTSPINAPLQTAAVVSRPTLRCGKLDDEHAVVVKAEDAVAEMEEEAGARGIVPAVGMDMGAVSAVMSGATGATGKQDDIVMGMGMGMDGACEQMRLGGATRLAPRPKGMGVNQGMVWGGAAGGVYGGGNAMAVVVRLQEMEKARKAEERRKKNRQAAARSNAKKKDLMDGIKAEICKSQQRADVLRTVQDRLRRENDMLKKAALQ